MVKRNTPDWQISAFDKDNNSYAVSYTHLRAHET